MPTPAELAADAKLKSEVEWGTYVATEPIFVNGARAFNVGHAVPVSHVESGLVDKSQVQKVKDAPTLSKAHAAEKKDN